MLSHCGTSATIGRVQQSGRTQKQGYSSHLPQGDLDVDMLARSVCSTLNSVHWVRSLPSGSAIGVCRITLAVVLSSAQHLSAHFIHLMIHT